MIMAQEKQICGICAWRKDCQKRFKLTTDAFLGTQCPDYTRDLSIKDVPPEIEDEKTAISRMVEEQLEKWRKVLRENINRGLAKEKFKGGPIITVSREPGSGGSEIARKLSKALGMDLIGAQIIQHVADSAKMSRKVIESLDEKEVTWRDTLLASLFRDRNLWPGEYLQHLTRVIGTIGIFGNAIIVGRGANYILPEETTFRVRVIAPLEHRIKYIMEDRGYTRSRAEQYVIRTENDRKAFVRRHFNVDVADHAYYDIIVNTGGMTLEAAAEAIISAFKRRFR
jgi:cytidylate kinase